MKDKEQVTTAANSKTLSGVENETLFAAATDPALSTGPIKENDLAAQTEIHGQKKTRKRKLKNK